ncbi:MAG: hypothetical protein U5J64_06165 [Halobacteriales archaeon]|nr:hypothetical protein [Halobacteriales archaeon]
MKPMREPPKQEASSIQIGFVLNAGIITTFTAVVLVILSGGFGEDVSTEDELELVADSVEAKMVEADTLTRTSGATCPDRPGDDKPCFTAFFSPSSSDVDYVGEIDSGGDLRLSADDGTVVERNLDTVTVDTDVTTDGGFTFTQNTENIIVEYHNDDDELVLDVQSGVSREAETR